MAVFGAHSDNALSIIYYTYSALHGRKCYYRHSLMKGFVSWARNSITLCQAESKETSSIVDRVPHREIMMFNASSSKKLSLSQKRYLKIKKMYGKWSWHTLTMISLFGLANFFSFVVLSSFLSTFSFELTIHRCQWGKQNMVTDRGVSKVFPQKVQKKNDVTESLW